MLTQHFKLGVQPFGVTPDGRFLYLSRTHREAIASLLYGIQTCRGFTALIAAPGMGKTTVLLHVLGILKGNSRTAFLFQTLCGPEQFLRSLLADLGIDDEGGDIAQMHAKLNAHLIQESNAGRQVVVVIDEAQNLDEPVLELVRMLSNFETPGKKLMQLILCGQPEFAEKLASERLTQLRQRISIVARLAPFGADETREYIDHRLRVAGAAPENTIFSRQAYGIIAAQSDGIPRNINNLCFNAMSLACALKKPQVDASMVRESVEDLNLSTLGAARGDYALPEAGAGVLTIPRWLPLSSSWRYSVGIAIGLFVALGLLAYNRKPSGDRLLREPPTASLPQRESLRDFEAIPAPKTISRGGEHEEVAQPAAGTQVTSRLGATRRRGRRPETAGTIPRHKPAGARRAGFAADRPFTAEKPVITLLPEDIERLQHMGATETRQEARKKDASPKQDHVPAEPTPQGEKR